MQFYARISARNNILLTRTMLNGVFCIRFAVGVQRTDEEHIRRAFDLLCAEAGAPREETL
jgi:aromatic-L-amino-acid decarboxylase